MTGRALILLCDLVGYSKLNDREQRDAVQKLWDAALSNSHVEAYLQADTSNYPDEDEPMLRLSGTGDGFYLVLWRYQDPDFPKLYEIARALIKEADGHGHGLNVVLHEGNASTYEAKRKRNPNGKAPSRKGGWEQIAGSGLVACRRLVDYADKGQVVFTVNYLDAWPDRLKQLIPRTLWPSLLNGMALPLNVKHNLVLRVHFETPVSSILLKKSTIVAEEIENELVVLMAAIHELLPDRKRRETGTRLTIFSPRYVSPEVSLLDCTRFRKANDPSISEIPSRTVYSIQPGAANGPGLAYVSRTPNFLIHLPDPAKDSAKYVREIQTKWGVGQDEVQYWSHKARAFISVPIGFRQLNADPIGVLCVDFASSLGSYKARYIDEVSRAILQLVQDRLVFLVELRSRV